MTDLQGGGLFLALYSVVFICLYFSSERLNEKMLKKERDARWAAVKELEELKEKI